MRTHRGAFPSISCIECSEQILFCRRQKEKTAAGALALWSERLFFSEGSALCCSSYTTVTLRLSEERACRGWWEEELGGGRGRKLATSLPFSWVALRSPEAGTSGKPASLVIYLSALPVPQHLNQKAMTSCTNEEAEGLAERLSSRNISSSKKSSGHRKPLSWHLVLRASVNMSNLWCLLIMWCCDTDF